MYKIILGNMQTRHTVVTDGNTTLYDLLGQYGFSPNVGMWRADTEPLVETDFDKTIAEVFGDNTEGRHYLVSVKATSNAR